MNIKNSLLTIMTLSLFGFSACEPPVGYSIPASDLQPLVVDQTMTIRGYINGTAQDISLVVRDSSGNGRADLIILGPGSINLEMYLKATETIGVYQLDFNGDGIPDVYLRNLINQGLEFNTSGNGLGSDALVMLDGTNALLGFDTSGDGALNLDIFGLPVVIKPFIDLSLDGSFGNSGSIFVPESQSRLLTLGFDDLGNRYVVSHNADSAIVISKYDSAGQPDSSYGSMGTLTWDYVSALAKQPVTGKEIIESALVDSQGFIYVALSFPEFYDSMNMSYGASYIVKFTPNGTLDSSFNGSGYFHIQGYYNDQNIGRNYPEFRDLVLRDSVLYISGGIEIDDPYDPSLNGFNITIWKVALDSPLPPSLGWDGHVFASNTAAPVDGRTGKDLLIAEDGSFYQGILSFTPLYSQTFSVMHYLPDGSLDYNFGLGGFADYPPPNGDEDVRLAFDSTGNLVLLTSPAIKESLSPPTPRLLGLNQWGEWLSGGVVIPKDEYGNWVLHGEYLSMGLYNNLLSRGEELYCYGGFEEYTGLKGARVYRITNGMLDVHFNGDGVLDLPLPDPAPWDTMVGKDLLYIEYSGDNFSAIIQADSGGGLLERRLLNYQPVY